MKVKNIDNNELLLRFLQVSNLIGFRPFTLTKLLRF